MKRLKHIFKKGMVFVLSLAMVAGLVTAMPGGANKVQAAPGSGTEPSVSAYATKTQLMDGTFAPNSSGEATNKGKLVFGKKSGGTTAQEWYILGKDNGVSGDNTIIFAASPIGTGQKFNSITITKTFDSSFGVYASNPSEVFPNHYGASDLRVVLQGMATNPSYFTTAEQGLMNATKVTTNDTKNGVTYTTTDKLYALAADGSGSSYKTIKAGTSDSTVLAMDIYWSSGDGFWLRSPDDDLASGALLAFPGYSVDIFDYVSDESAVQPASNLNLSSVLFASAATAASSDTVVADKITSGTAMTLRLDGSSENIGKAYFSKNAGIIRAEKLGGDNISLVVQGKGTIAGLESDWYYSKQITGTEIIDASDIKNTLNLTDDIDLSACKIWLEKTATNGMVYAVEAKDIRSISTSGHQLFVKTTSGSHITLEVEPTNTIRELKEKITDKKGISSDTQRLLFKGKELKDEYCISDYCILKDDTLHLLIQSSVEPYIMNIGAAHLQGNSGWEKSDGLKLRFGKRDRNVTEYRVLGDTPDSQSVSGGTGILLNADNVIENSHMQFNNTRTYLQQLYNNGDVFSALEKAAIMETTLNARSEYTVNTNNFKDTESSDYIFLLSAHEASNLYLSDADRNNGAHCWLRSIDSTNSSNAASYYGNGKIDKFGCANPYIRVTPAFNIRPSEIIFTFHSNVDKATANGITNKKYSDASYNNNTWKLTLKDSSKTIKVTNSKKVTRDSNDKLNIPFDYMTDLNYEVNQVSVMITDKGYNDNGAKILYYGKLDTTMEYDYTSGSMKEVFGNGIFVLPEELRNKKLGEDYHLYMMAEHISENNTTDYSSVPTEIMDVELLLEQFNLSVDAPNSGAVLDTSVICDTSGISINSTTWTDDDDICIVPIGEKAGYNKKYSISVKLSADTGCKFVGNVTAKVNGNTATSVTKNADGTLTVTYAFPVTAKDKLISITAPQAITVANGTAYSAMNLPATVNIVTEGNTVSSASVTWDTTTPASGSYDPAVLTEQTVTLNGTVDCPVSIDANGVSLTTTITITIKANTSDDKPSSGTDKKDDVPKTGDNTPIAWLFILSILSGTGLILTAKKRRKNLSNSRKRI
ncbi:MAG: ubiquitin-like protein [Butyrivibrio sp.]|nr:ubiquitin-like protein [Butyrivibrio sp.]